MATLLLYPAQVLGIARAVTELEQFKQEDDEYVHITESTDGTGFCKIELTNPPYSRTVREDGSIL